MREDFSISKERPSTFVVRQNELEGRLDPSYYHPKTWKTLDALENTSFEIKEIDAISKLVTKGESPLWRGDFFTKKGIPFLKGINVKEGRITLENVVFIAEEVHKRMKRSQLKPGNILLTMAGTLGDAAVVPDNLKEANINQDLAKIVLNEDINPHYVSIFLNSIHGKLQVERKSDGMTRRHINFVAIKSIKIPIPPRPIQDRIAEIMEEAYKQRKEKLKEAEDLLAGINDYVLDKLGIAIPEVEEKKSFVVSLSDLKGGGRHDVFYYQPKYTVLTTQLETCHYEVAELKEIIKEISGGATPRAKGDAYTNEKNGMPFLRIQNIGQGYIDLTDVKYITPEIHNTLLKRSQINPKDILFTITGRIGTTAVVPDKFGEANINQHIVRMKIKGEVNPYYVEVILNSSIGQIQSERKTTGTTRIALDYPSIKSIKIPVPPIEIQKEIATEVQCRRGLAKRLRGEANEILEEAKKCVEWIIMGGEEKTRETIRLIADKLKKSYNPEKIILYGSYAWGLPDEDSDIDLLVIKDTKERPHDRIVNASRIISPLRRGYAVDIFVITPEELKSRLEIGDQFLQEIISRGEVLYG